MNSGNTEEKMSKEKRDECNTCILDFLMTTMNDSGVEVGGLRTKLSATYWVIIGLSIIMFAIGIVLLSVPVVAAFRSNIQELQSLIAAGFGVVDLAGLFLFRPVERIHALMGDMSQITIAINSFQTQVGLQLLEMNVNEEQTIEGAAVHISEAAKSSIKLVQDYFESKGKAR